MTTCWRRRMTAAAVLATAALLTAACGGGEQKKATDDEPDRGRPQGLAAQVASYDVVAGRTGRFIVGLLAGDQTKLVAFGTVQLTFRFLGTRGSDHPSGTPTPPVTARFLPIPGQHVDADGPGPRFVEASEGIGVYGADGVTFDRSGFWQVEANATIDGAPRTAKAAFAVLDTSSIPAVGDNAPRTDHPVSGAAGVDPRSIDSRAAPDTAIPDAELHSTTIAEALAAGRPLMVVVSTPTYCMSRFCGPITDSVSALAKQHGDRMAFVHLEVWKNFDKSEINKAAAEWIFPPGSEDAREPWVFVVGRDGRITHRFDNVATDDELERAVAQVTG